MRFIYNVGQNIFKEKYEISCNCPQCNDARFETEHLALGTRVHDRELMYFVTANASLFIIQYVGVIRA